MAGERYKSKYTNNLGNTIPVLTDIEYKTRGFFGNLRNVRNGETPTDTVLYVYPQVEGGMPQRITRSPGEVTTERMDNSTGEWIPQMHNLYWDDKSKQVFKNKERIPSLWERAMNFVGFKQEGGNLTSSEQIQKEFMAFLIQEAAEQGITIKSLEDFKAYVENLGEEGLQAKLLKFMQLKAQQTQQQKGTPTAAKGTKLNYIRELKGLCPEGYLKAGGRCKPCEAKMKEKGGEMDPVKSFKANRKNKK